MATTSTKNTARTVSLCIGVDYAGSEHALRGCVNDAENIAQYLVKSGAVAKEDATVLREPTRAEIMRALEQIAKVTREGGVANAFVSISGHGCQIADRARAGTGLDELDGRDEAFCPFDFQSAGVIRDDDLAAALAKFDRATAVAVLTDCCHSGSMLDLPYEWRSFGDRRMASWKQPAHPNVRMISGCTDAQTSADAFDRRRSEYTGAMSSSFLDVLAREPALVTDSAALVAAMRVLVDERRYSQIPVLSTTSNDARVPFLA